MIKAFPAQGQAGAAAKEPAHAVDVSFYLQFLPQHVLAAPELPRGSG